MRRSRCSCSQRKAPLSCWLRPCNKDDGENSQQYPKAGPQPKMARPDRACFLGSITGVYQSDRIDISAVRAHFRSFSRASRICQVSADTRPSRSTIRP